jgi:hypothetical protein
VIRASAVEDLAPLIALCKQGKLFDVQEWVRHGRPIASPEGMRGKGSRMIPLRIAIDCGFHSLVQVLLEGGAPVRERGYRALDQAVSLRRPDLAELLFKHGALVEDVSMRSVLETWDPEMVALFRAHGASLQKNRPVAWALIAKMRPVLGLVKREGETNPDLLAQAGIALRYHANEGNPKWVSLLLWAGADACERGIYRLEELEGDVDTDEEAPSAIELAVMSGQLDVLKVPRMLAACASPRQPTGPLLEAACFNAGPELLAFLFQRGHRPDAIPDQGTRAITVALHSMTYEFSTFFSSPDARHPAAIDSSRSRSRMKIVHMLLANGAKWRPQPRDIADVRRSLLRMAPDYLLEFAWLLQTYRAARRTDVAALFKTPSIRRVLGTKTTVAEQLVAGIPDEIAGSVAAG